MRIMEIRYPEIFVPLVGYDGNAFGILARCHRAMRRAGLSESEWEEFRREATSGRYEHLLVTVCTWFDTGLDDREVEDLIDDEHVV
jgi:hypothetical protein